ncbi:hypothetical protein MSG28_012838 [Choristoneura fumiferana]|uniref:Uncharacterized protein n=1 Tax=Choristoneura fumiferana TaxID=7141 RepID=A0ACC0JI90_CHOFU|nr:hypothetical protein MSG28_012838 [Choristoneura fumiferana]
MSLLEDVFLEDEAGEAQELERVIEGDEFDDRPRTPDSNSDSEKEDEAEEDKRRVDHTEKAKRVVKNPRFVLNPARLTGPRGIQILPDHFKDFKFKGKGHERDDLDVILKKLEHWAYRLYPKFKFDDCLKKIEALGKKRPVMVHLHKIRSDQLISEETVVQQDSSGDEAAPEPPEEDEFDRLLQQQIDLARATPTPGSVRKELHTPIQPIINRSPLMAPKVSSSPSISDDQKERMIRNRKLAEERRLARLNQVKNNVDGNTNIENEKDKPMEKIEINDEKTNEDNNVAVVRKHKRSNVIDSSDDETNIVTVNESIQVDVHNHAENRKSDFDEENTDGITVNPEILRKEGTTIEKHIEIDSTKDAETIIDSHEPEIISENLANNQAVLENYINFDKIEVANDNNENNAHDTQESRKNNSQSKETIDKSSVTEDLMDVEFSEDF